VILRYKSIPKIFKHGQLAHLYI